MSPVLAVRCESCGGAVAWSAGKPAPACVFCGATALETVTPPEGVETPEGFLPFEVDENQAHTLFKKRASASIWYPSDLRHARVALRAVLVPAWSWSSRLETHYTAIVTAMQTRSNKRPVADEETWSAAGVLVPSSQTLSRTELSAISPFQSGKLRPVAETELPYEMGSLTRTAARAQGEEGMGRLHMERLRERLGAHSVATSTLFHELQGGPLLLPVWIGAYRRGDAMHRVVINGQTGSIVGSFPYSWTKIAAATVAVLVILAVCAGVLGTAGLVGGVMSMPSGSTPAQQRGHR